MGAKYLDWETPKIYKGKKWYVEYRYRIPEDLRSRYGNKEWLRIKVYENINRHKTDEYATLLRDAVEEALKQGYNPFKYETPDTVVTPNVITLGYAVDKFMQASKEKELRPKTVAQYNTVANWIKDYFRFTKLTHDIKEIGTDDIKAMLNHYRVKNSWQPYTFNNYVEFTSIFFNYFIKQDWITKNPCIRIDKKKVGVTKNKYYTDEQIKKIKKLCNEELWDFIQFCYYTGIRPKTEARLLKVEHILKDSIFIPASISKNRKDDYVPIVDELKQIIKKYTNKPDDHYLFGGVKPKAMNYWSVAFKPIKDKLKLGNDYTLYSFKHTRAIHLAKAGASPYDIMKLFRHSSLDMTMKYLRELNIENDEINKKTRKL